jgi:hypothetical protein
MMSLSSLRRTYGRGDRHEVVNRAIRVEIKGGSAVLDGLAALHGRIRRLQQAGEVVPPSLQNQFDRRIKERDRMAADIEAKHEVGENLNCRAGM